MRHRVVSTIVLIAITLIAACGDDDESAPSATTAGPTAAPTAGSSPATTAGSTAATTATSGPVTTVGATAATTAGSTPGTPVIDPGDGGNYAPNIDPANFVAVVDNEYMPWLAGSRWAYEGEVDGDRERTEVVVTRKHKTIMGIEATVVRDTVYSGDEVKEDTFDWYAQDRDGNVWYLGEDTKEYEDGKVASTEGSWEAGVDGAQPGIVMPADPTVGFAYRQEYYAGEAEDMGEIIEVGGSVDVRAGHYDDVITTKDWTPLEPAVIEQKMYAPGVGVVREELVAGGDELSELVEFTPPG
jgi:hypothetical protein